MSNSIKNINNATKEISKVLKTPLPIDIHNLLVEAQECMLLAEINLENQNKRGKTTT